MDNFDHPVMVFHEQAKNNTNIGFATLSDNFDRQRACCEIRRNSGGGSKSNANAVSVSEKWFLTLEEAALCSGIGVNKLRAISNEEGCPFVLWNGTKRLLKRDKLKEYLDGAYSI